MIDRLRQLSHEPGVDTLAETLDGAPVMLHSIDAERRLARINRLWASRLGYQPQEMIGRDLTEFMAADSRSRAVEQALPAFIRHGIIEDARYDFVHRDGSIVPVTLSAVASYDGDGSFASSLALVRDADIFHAPGAKDWPRRHAADALAARSPMQRIADLPMPLRILVAEDNAMNQRVLQAFMAPAPIDALFVWNGREALEALAAETFDAAIFDIDMPVMNGAEAVRRFRENEGENASAAGGPRLPIVACTALKPAELVNAYRIAGFDHYLSKPVSLETFADCLDWIVALRSGAASEGVEAG